MSSKPEVQLTPMQQQYREFRGKLPAGTLLLFRLGDFYEMFGPDAETGSRLLGITLTAAGPGEPVNVQRSGVLDDAGWSWTPGRVWLGVDGRLTQTPPADGFDVLIGAATSATRITLNLTDPIELE